MAYLIMQYKQGSVGPSGPPQNISKAFYADNANTTIAASDLLKRGSGSSPDGQTYLGYGGGTFASSGDAGFITVDDTGGVTGTYNVHSTTGVAVAAVFTDTNYVYLFWSETPAVFQTYFYVAMYAPNGSGGFTLIKATSVGNTYAANHIYDVDDNYIYITQYAYNNGGGYRITRNDVNLPITTWTTTTHDGNAGSENGPIQRWKGYPKIDLTAGSYGAGKYLFTGVTQFSVFNSSAGTLEGIPAGTGTGFGLGNTTDTVKRPVSDTDSDGTSSYLVGIGSSMNAANQNKIFFCRVDPSYTGANPGANAVSELNEFTAPFALFDGTAAAGGTFPYGHIRYLPSLDLYVFFFAYNTYGYGIVGYYDDKTSTVLSCSKISVSGATFNVNYSPIDLGDAINGIAYINAGTGPIPVFEHSSTVSFSTPNRSAGVYTWTYEPVTLTKAAASWMFTNTAFTPSISAATLSLTVDGTDAASKFPATLTSGSTPAIYTATIS